MPDSPLRNRRIARGRRLQGKWLRLALTLALAVFGLLPGVTAEEAEEAASATEPTPSSTSPAEAAQDHWAYLPVQSPAPPEVGRADWCRTPIDRFILAGLEGEEFEPALDLPRAKLVRRLYFDLWGLPPKPEEVQAFVADPSPDAVERLVDRLLASPRYGERWGRYWLDRVRFAETNGYERDALKTDAWRYRDWVIKALNDDLPYDRFVLAQLAGDEMPGHDESSLVATGFLRVGTLDDEPNDPLQYQYEQLDDLMHATSTAFLAVTLKCARCHDHKFDPIPQRDYYAMLNFFRAGQATTGAGDALGYTDSGRDASPVKLLKGGDPRQEGDVVAPGFLSMLPAIARAVEPPPSDSPTTTRRTQLARWITDPKNPLTPRVAVNFLWQHHFGQGLVRTPDNFGVMGSTPTHPELLDWLAEQLIAGGWRLKPLHRMILLSRTYQMDSSHPREQEFAQRDFENEYWWRANRRRLEAEPLRDAMLAVNGTIDLRAGGVSFIPPASPEALEGLSKKGAAWTPSPPGEQRRRSIYMFTKRSLLLPLMTTFDFADTTQPCCQRNISTVAPQALVLLNNEFVHEQSAALAERVLSESADNDTTRIHRAWWLALGRPATETELPAALGHLSKQRALFVERARKTGVASPPPGRNPDQLAWASLCHVLLNLNEFLYVD